MIVNLCDHDCTELWEGVLYKKLSHYPNISDWEMKNIIDFIAYEELYHRTVEIRADRPDILKEVNEKLRNKEEYKNVTRPSKITECTACPYRKGCLTEFVCHTAPKENAKSILESGTLLSAVNARKLPAEALMKEERNAAKDPADFFSYVMFTWGNCQAGDRLVMERKNNRPPTEEDLGKDLTPGIRFYFKYDILTTHPDAVQDGFLPLKVKDKVELNQWVYAIIIPEEYKEELVNRIPADLASRTYYIANDCKDVWDWSEKVYTFVEKLEEGGGTDGQQFNLSENRR